VDDALDVPRLVPDLPVGESERHESRRRVDLIAEPVPRLLLRRPVIAEPVSLDDQAQSGPEEVDPESVDAPLGLRAGQAPLEAAINEADMAKSIRVRTGVVTGMPW
jgi:hypothetical protein